MLRPGGIIRIAVPNLEQITTLYLEALHKALDGDEPSRCNYDWLMLELYDQTVREKSGGAMLQYLSQDELPNRDFVLDRIGAEARAIFESRDRAPAEPGQQATSAKGRWVRRLLRRYTIGSGPASSHEEKLQRLLGPEYALLQIGRFRSSGEIHLWMYDRHSLRGFY